MFYAEFDNGISTNIPWYRPDLDSVKEWYKELSSKVDMSSYDVRLIGAVAEGVQTWDVDIILMGDVNNHFELKNILDIAHILGFQHSLLIDIFWTNVYLPEFIKLNKDWSNCKRIRNHKVFKKNINGREEIYDFTLGYEYTELIPGLYEYKGLSENSIQKTTKRLNDNIYKGIYTELRYVI